LHFVDLQVKVNRRKTNRRKTRPYCISNRLPEDEPSISKHAEDNKNLKLNY